MESNNSVGIMIVVAISGSVALAALQAHKRLVADFMKKVESEFGTGMEREATKKKVRFAEDVIEPSSNNKEYRMRHSKIQMGDDLPHNGNSISEMGCGMQLNRLVLYKGIMESRMPKGRVVSYSR